MLRMSSNAYLLLVCHCERDVGDVIRINAQWRLCFVWAREGATGVEIVDYH